MSNPVAPREGDAAVTHSFDVSALGLRIRISFDPAASSQFVQHAKDAWSDALLPPGGEPDAEVSVPHPGDEDLLLERLSVDVTLSALSGRRGAMLMFHAAGIADADGRVFAFVGPSGRGKTTLSRVLGQVYGYVSDETIAVGDELGVFPYRKPLSLVRDGLPKDQVAPSALRLRDLPDAPLRLEGLIVLNRVAECAKPTMERVPLVEVIDDVVAQMSFLPELEQPLQRLAGVVDSVGGLMRLTYSESAEVLPLIEKALSGGVPPERTDSLQPMIQAPDSVNSAMSTGDIVDAIGDTSAVCVLSGRTIRVLGGIAPEIWRGTLAGLDRGEIRDAVVERYGSPPDGDAGDLVDAAIDDLIAAGLLVGAPTADAPAAQAV